jgi:hypothetical protein
MGGGPILWKSKLQGLVTLSTAEAEYVTACIAAQQGSYLHNLLSELVDDKLPVLMLIDNQSAIHMAANGDQMQRTRHMALKLTTCEIWSAKANSNCSPAQPTTWLPT